MITSYNLLQKMRSLSDYRYWKFHFDCMRASNFRSENPMGGPFDPPRPLGRSRVKYPLPFPALSLLRCWTTVCNNLRQTVSLQMSQHWNMLKSKLLSCSLFIIIPAPPFLFWNCWKVACTKKNVRILTHNTYLNTTQNGAKQNRVVF